MARSGTPHCSPIHPAPGDPRPHPQEPTPPECSGPTLAENLFRRQPRTSERPCIDSGPRCHPTSRRGPDRLPRHVGRTRHERTAFLGCIFRPCRRRTHPRRAAPTDHQVGRQTPATRRDTTKTQRAEESPCQPKPLSHIDTNLCATLIRTHRHRPRSSPSTTADPSKGLHEETRIVTLAGNEQDFGPT